MNDKSLSPEAVIKNNNIISRITDNCIKNND